MSRARSTTKLMSEEKLELSLLSKNDVLSKSFRILFDLIQSCARIENV